MSKKESVTEMTVRLAGEKCICTTAYVNENCKAKQTQHRLIVERTDVTEQEHQRTKAAKAGKEFGPLYTKEEVLQTLRRSMEQSGSYVTIHKKVLEHLIDSIQKF